LIEEIADEKDLIFCENLVVALKHILDGKTRKEEFDWQVKGKTGFKIFKSDAGAIIVVRKFGE